LPIQFGGGIRSVDKALETLDMLEEKDKIILGTLAVSDYPKFSTLKSLSRYSERIIASVDSKEGYVAVKGWQEKSQIKAKKMIRGCEGLVWGYLYTNVDVEGKMKGIEREKVREVVSATKKPTVVSGGITTLEDVKSCEEEGAWGVVLGKALYEGKIVLTDLDKKC
jgi:phosphoribosylformimino-5-aminoimidazole carboxamide ribotide isomerase